MDRQPQPLARLIGLEDTTFGARVQEVVEVDGKVRIRADTAGGSVEGHYDKVILAIHPSALRMIPKRPRWSPRKEEAIRSIYFEALYKLGLRFKIRFWERFNIPSLGGQSTTDLPIRWIVYPSYGIGNEGLGVLLLYSWMTDASHLKEVYQDEGVDVHDESMEAHDMPWAEHNPTGDCIFLPKQFTKSFHIAQKPEGNIYFAGEHLSRHHTWITGALDSGRLAATAVVKDFLPLKSDTLNYSGWILAEGGAPEEDYDPESQRRAFIESAIELHTKDLEICKNAIFFRGCPEICKNAILLRDCPKI